MAAEIGRLLTAMVTPFKADGSVDHESAQTLARQLVQDGSDGVVVAGTTGESPTLSDDEKIELVARIKEAIPGRNVVAGTGGNDTRHSIDLSERAIRAGADALLCVVPYYNKPTQEGMYQHFKAIAATGPVIMYNIQGRTAINMTAATTLRCAQEPGIIGVKEASGDIDQMGLVCAGKPSGFQVWSGDDSFTLPLLAVGGYGVICVVSHLAGRAMKSIKTLMTTASNPIPVKSAINALGFPAGPFRLPLTPMPTEDLDRVMKSIQGAADLITFKAGVRAA
jgi:4-hydroxy-tetrahydrodipicolinate synthase